MKRKLLGMLLSVAMVATVFTGCGSKAAEAPADDTKTEAPADDAKDEAPADDAVYNADTGFIPPIEGVPAENDAPASNPFVGR